MGKQLYLDFDGFADDLPEKDIDTESSLRPIDLRRAVLAWLLPQDVAGVATKVPTRVSRFRADVAAFWNVAARNTGIEGPSRVLAPTRTMIVECRRRRDDCWPDVSNSAELLPQLRELKRERRELEALIRDQEPHLRDDSGLFPEYTDWNYEDSDNPEYRRVRRELKRLEHAIYKGSRFESIRAAELADILYLAVPERSVHPHELADGWGLLWVKRDLTVEVVAPPTEHECQPDNRMHLVQNIAAAATQHVAFAHGVFEDDGRITFLPVPRRRRPRSRRGRSRQDED